MKNSHIKSYIEYYLDLKSEPHFAIMLKGAWGTGKTWFVDEAIKDYTRNNEGFKYIKVSLYGMTSIKQIEDEMFRQLHPVLSNKFYVLGANVLKSVLKATVKLDIDNSGDKETSINAKIPDINLEEFARTPEGFALIFDDIERSSMNLKDLFGYINHFVEVNGYKAILITNEDEILASNDELFRNEYKRFKEKLIGKTFNIESDFESACNKFMKEITHKTVRDTIKKDLKVISTIYIDAGYNNLRHVRQFFLDFDRICINLPPNYIENEEFLRVFSHQLMILSIEYRAGNLAWDDFLTIGQDSFISLSNHVKPETKYQKIRSKHSILSLSETLLTGEQWRDVICDGKISSENIMNSLNSSKYFLTRNSAPWEYLWGWYRLDEVTLYEKHSETKRYFSEGKLDGIGEILMISSILLNLIEQNLTEDDSAEIIEIGSRKILEYYENMSSYELMKERNNIRYNDFSGYRGLGYLSAESDKFKYLIKIVQDIRLSCIDEALPDLAKQFIIQLQRGETTLLSELCVSNSNVLNIYQQDFLSLVEPNVFMDCYIKLNPEMMLKVNSRMKARYENELYRDLFSSEKNWLISLGELAENIIDGSDNKFIKYHADIFKKYVIESSLALLSKEERQSPPNI